MSWDMSEMPPKYWKPSQPSLAACWCVPCSPSETIQGQIPHHPYAKWRGAHWVLACLADLGYPPGDTSLQPLMEQVYAWLLGRQHTQSIKTIDGRVRRCASMEGNALYASLCLGLADERSEELAARLVRWQWPDGGWNCDKRPGAHNSSYNESLDTLCAPWCSMPALLETRALALLRSMAAEIFLKRRLFKRQSDGQPIHEDFITLHYPCYWHYDFLFALKVLAEGGWIADPRCAEALDLLESKRLQDVWLSGGEKILLPLAISRYGSIPGCLGTYLKETHERVCHRGCPVCARICAAACLITCLKIR